MSSLWPDAQKGISDAFATEKEDGAGEEFELNGDGAIGPRRGETKETLVEDERKEPRNQLKTDESPDGGKGALEESAVH